MSVLGLILLLFQTQLGSASGIVTRPGSTEPLSGATVFLIPASATQTAGRRTTISQDDGRFMIPDIQPGEYRLEVHSSRYGSVSYGQRKPYSPGAVLRVSSGQQITDLKVSMLSTGTIAGRITGTSGEPLAHANVQALKYVYEGGRRVLALAQSTTTDDRGEYRLFWLPTGQYVVVAAPRSPAVNLTPNGPRRPGEVRVVDLAYSPGANQLPDALIDPTNHVTRLLEDGSVREESWMPTYHPSTTDPARAVPVEVTGAATVPGINIVLSASPVQKIRGRVTGLVPGTQATVTLSPAAPGTVGRIIGKGASTVDGSFEFAGVVPGPYFLTARDRSGLVAPTVAVLVGDRDVNDVSLGLAMGVQLTARLTVEGEAEPIRFGSIIAALHRDSSAPPGRLTLAATVMTSGGSLLALRSIVAGNYLFDLISPVLQPNQKPLYIKSIRLGGQDALNTFHISSNTTGVLEVVLTSNPGIVEGVVFGRTGDAAGNVTVVLVPTHARKRSSFYKIGVTASDGRFHFPELSPGDYKLFAWEDVETGVWENEEFIRQYESRGTAIRISEGSREEVQLRVIANP